MTVVLYDCADVLSTRICGLVGFSSAMALRRLRKGGEPTELNSSYLSMLSWKMCSSQLALACVLRQYLSKSSGFMPFLGEKSVNRQTRLWEDTMAGANDVRSEGEIV